MYAKVFTSMWDGSLHGHLEASAVLMALVTLCNADGVIDMTPEAISGRTGWPIDFIRKGIGELEAPDFRSRTPDDEGRRIVRLDSHREWGWIIVNYRKYRQMSDPDVIRNQTRERVRKYREKTNGVSRDVTHGNAPKRQAEALSRSIKKEDSPSLRSGERRGSKTAPEDFSPDLAFARAEVPDIDAETEAAKFRDWEFKTPRVDWDRTWRRWVRQAKESGRYAKSSTPPVIAGPTSDGKPPRWQ